MAYDELVDLETEALKDRVVELEARVDRLSVQLAEVARPLRLMWEQGQGTVVYPYLDPLKYVDDDLEVIVLIGEKIEEEE